MLALLALHLHAPASAATFQWGSAADLAAGSLSGLDGSAAGALSVTAASGWYSSSWGYRLPITVTEGSGAALTDYTVELTLDTASLVSAGYLRSSGADLRFTDASGTRLDHWVESGLNTATTQVWVQVPTLAASSSTTIYLYTGNAAAADVGSHSAAFLWWDDFSTNTIASYTRLGLDGASADSWSISGGYLGVSTSTGYSAALVSSLSLTDDYEVSAPAYTDDDDGLGLVGNVNSAGTSYYRATGWPSGPTVTGILGGDAFAASSTMVGSGATYTYTFRKTGTRLEMLLDGVSVAVGSDTTPLTGAGVGVWSYRNNPGAWFDALQVRSYVYPEPSGAAGSVSGLYSGAGEWDSEVVDSGCADSAWDSMVWTQSVPSGAAVTVSVRAGDTGVPDASWSAWTPVSSSGASPGQVGRYAQVKVELTGSLAGTPTVSGLELGVTEAEDADGDGHDTLACGGDDCDDLDFAVSPSASESCNAVDDDCDGTTDEDDAVDASAWYADADGDSYGDPAASTRACSVPSGHVADATDCDDTAPAVNPAATEVCNGSDDDCDTTVDEPDAADASVWYADTDGDTYGDAGASTPGCAAPGGYVADATDCDDTDAAVHPGAADAWYDGVDQDCAGDDDYDADGDGSVSDAYAGDDCDDADPTVNPDAIDPWYDGVDQDCGGEDDYDADGDGHTSASHGGDDCDDSLATTYPGAPDAPYDGVVTDCDDSDEYDVDADGHDDLGFGGDDCDDARSDVYPGAGEQWYDGVDQDCDGNDADQDGDGVILTYDCDDEDPAVSPNAAEVDGNGVDDDCDGQTDTPAPDDTGDGAGSDGGCGCAAPAADVSVAMGAIAALAALARRRPQPARGRGPRRRGPPHPALSPAASP